jgi:hypothetical protein
MGKISSIRVENEKSWQDKVYLTLDIDWANDGVLNHVIDLVEESGVEATWFVTHETPLLERLRKNQLFELGIHPNFNFLVNGNFIKGKNLEDVVDRMLEIVPEAKSVASHSLTQSSLLLEIFADRGLTHDRNTFIPFYANVELKPWILPNGIIKTPFFWGDDEFLFGNSDLVLLHELIHKQGLRSFLFHPIHIFLNSENVFRYTEARKCLNDFVTLKNIINQNKFGTGDFFKSLLSQIKNINHES